MEIFGYNTDDAVAKISNQVGSSIDSGYDYLSSKATEAYQAASQFHSDNTNRQGIPPQAGNFNANKYSIDQYSYPSDLMSEVYGGSYAMFYINVAVESVLNVKENTVELDPATEPRMRGSLVAKGTTTGQLAAAVTGFNVVNGISEGKNVKDTAKDTLVGAVAVGTAGVFSPDATRSQRRLKTAIAMHVPNALSVRYGMQWSEEDTAGLQFAMDIAQKGIKPSASGKLSAMGAAGLEYGAAVGLQKLPTGAASAMGIASNPKREQTFKGVDFRKFTFEYQFFPRDAKEAQNVLNIINQFKIHMHPEFKSDLNYVWIYPSEFDIIYYVNGQENTNIHRHTSCVLEEMSVNYTPNGNFTTFIDGMPTQMNMSLTFRELQVLSRETVMGGL